MVTKESSKIAIAPSYSGNLVMSDNESILAENVNIEHLNDLLVKVNFKMGEEVVVFRAIVKEQDQGSLMLIQNRVTKDYILNGQSGFLHKDRSVHGGFLHDIESFYFHVNIHFFNGRRKEIYFLGKDAQSESVINHTGSKVKHLKYQD
jgi:hypothetical protein